MTDRKAAAEDFIELPALFGTGIPPAPPPELDPYLDAAADVFARYGITRSSVQDIARRLGLNRATVYRQVGTVENVVRLLLAREIRRALALLPASPTPGAGPEYVVDLVAALVIFAREHPVVLKVVHDEPELIGPFLVTDMPALIGRVSETVRPLLEAAIGTGAIAARDPGAVAEWVTRIGLSLIVAPSTTDVRDFLSAVLVPALTDPRERRS